MNQHLGKSVRIYMAEGTPQGLLTAEIVNWSGHVLSAPRSKLINLVGHEQAKKSGVYILTGIDPETGDRLIAYIGQSEEVGRRLTQHNKKDSKIFWERTCAITSKDLNLTTGHIKYLESRLIDIARKSGKVSLTNDTAPEPSKLPEADIADMEFFVSQVRLVLPLLGFEFLREIPTITKPSTNSMELLLNDSRSPVFEIISPKHKLTATGQEIDGEFIVHAGAQCRASWEGSGAHNYRNLRNTLEGQGKIAIPPDGKNAVFTEDVAFSSPSAAAAIVYGRASNGRTAWKVKGENRTYDDWQNSLLPETTGGEA